MLFPKTKDWSDMELTVFVDKKLNQAYACGKKVLNVRDTALLIGCNESGMRTLLESGVGLMQRAYYRGVARVQEELNSNLMKNAKSLDEIALKEIRVKIDDLRANNI